MKRLSLLTVLGALALSASCRGPEPGDGGSGGAPIASGGSGTIPGSGGSSGGSTPTGGTGGDVAALGGAAGEAGAAGAAGAPACDCPSDTHITLELPSGPRVYELASDPDSCNVFSCEPPGPSVSLGHWRHDRYSFRACHSDGGCVDVSTNGASFDATEGRIVLLQANMEPTLDESVTLELTELPGDGSTAVEITFETVPGTGTAVHGTGRACLVESFSICAI